MKLTIDPKNRDLKLHIRMDQAYEESVPFALDLGSLAPGLELGSLSNMLGSSGNIGLSAGAAFVADIIINFKDPDDIKVSILKGEGIKNSKVKTRYKKDNCKKSLNGIKKKLCC